MSERRVEILLVEDEEYDYTNIDVLKERFFQSRLEMESAMQVGQKVSCFPAFFLV